jgi:energy-coupling factor transporter transmembrane protein EcfT
MVNPPSLIAMTLMGAVAGGLVMALIVFVLGILVGFLIRKLIVAAIVIGAIVLILLLIGVISPRGMAVLIHVLGFSLAAAAFLSGLLLSLGVVMIVIFLVGLLIGFFASR